MLKKKKNLVKAKEYNLDEKIMWNLHNINYRYKTNQYFQREIKNCAGDANTCAKSLMQDCKELSHYLQSNVVNEDAKIITRSYLNYLTNYDMMKNRESVA